MRLVSRNASTIEKNISIMNRRDRDRYQRPRLAASPRF